MPGFISYLQVANKRVSRTRDAWLKTAPSAAGPWTSRTPPKLVRQIDIHPSVRGIRCFSLEATTRVEHVTQVVHDLPQAIDRERDKARVDDDHRLEVDPTGPRVVPQLEYCSVAAQEPRLGLPLPLASDP
jgi:hypothetical protein